VASSVFIDSLGLTMLTLRESEFVHDIQWDAPDHSESCFRCGKPVDATVCVDHVAPIAKGGVHIAENLRCAHSFCNAVKGAKPLTDSLRDECRKRIRAHLTLVC
jgi:5-methylcytosine-specific restriction endonuclease McrA